MSQQSGDSPVSSENAFETIEEFLAHAYALETEVSERYEEIAQSMEVHNNPEVAEVFAKLARASRKHAAQMRERVKGRELPRIAPWDFQWGPSEAPETPDMQDTHYLMTPYQALDLARNAEIRAQSYYASVADSSPTPAVRNLAMEFAYEEAEHVDLVNRWIAKLPKPEDGWDYDPDPPVIPE